MKKFEIMEPMNKNCNLVGTRMHKDGKEELLFQPENTSEFIGFTHDDLLRVGYIDESQLNRRMGMIYVDLTSKYGVTNWMLVKNSNNQWTI